MQCLVICWQQVLCILLQSAFEICEHNLRLLQPMPVLDSVPGFREQGISSVLQLWDHISSPGLAPVPAVRNASLAESALLQDPSFRNGLLGCPFKLYLSFALLHHSDNNCYLTSGGSSTCYEVFSAVLSNANSFILCCTLEAENI